MYERIAEAVADNPGVCLVIGAPDTGKSTFCAFLASYCAERGLSTAVIDADVGQADIGPPATVSMGQVAGVHASLADIAPAAHYFVGSISPRGAETLSVVAGRRMVDEAKRRGSDVIIIDTTGAVRGRMGRMLKTAKMDVLLPAHVVALQRENELEHLPLRHHGVPALRAPALPGARSRSRWERAFLRRQRFAQYLVNLEEQTISWDSLILRRTFLLSGRPLDRDLRLRLTRALGDHVHHGEEVPEGLLAVVDGRHRREAIESVARKEGVDRLILLRREDLSDLYIGLDDERGDCLGVGLLRQIDFTCGVIRMGVPPGLVHRVAGITLGSIRVSPDGKELGFSPAGLRS